MLQSGPRCGRLGRGRSGGLVGTQEHFVAGGVLGASLLLLHQELFKLRGGEGERLPAQLHQVGVLKPGVGEAVLGGWTSPVITHTHTHKHTDQYVAECCLFFQTDNCSLPLYHT